MKQKPMKKCENGVPLRPASMEEAGLFYSQVEEDRDWQSGTVGHVRMDFGHRGKEFWHTWWPHNQDQFNTPEFKETLQTVVDALRRDGPLKDTTATYNAGGYGYYVVVDHGNGMVTLYAHNSRLLVRVGETVEAGDVVSLSGSTGRSTGPHLHFEVRVNGQRVNPRSYLPTS